MQDYTKSNFAALDDKKINWKDFSNEQLVAAGMNNRWQRYVNPKVFIAVIIGVIVLVFGVASLLFDSDIRDSIYKIGLFIVILLVSTVFGARDNHDLRILKFALDNNSQFRATAVEPPTEPIIFNIGKSRSQTNTIKFPDGSIIAHYRYLDNSILAPHRVFPLVQTQGADSKNSEYHAFVFMRVKLPRPVPHMYLDSKRNGVNPNMWGYETQKLKLEGDFNKYFTLFIPPNYHIDVLQILTPDVMAALVDHGQGCDYELVGDSLYIYQGSYMSKSTFDSADGLRKFLSSVVAIAGQIAKQAETYNISIPQEAIATARD